MVLNGSRNPVSLVKQYHLSVKVPGSVWTATAVKGRLRVSNKNIGRNGDNEAVNRRPDDYDLRRKWPSRGIHSLKLFTNDTARFR